MGLAMLPLYELPHWSKAEGGEARRGVARFVGLESIQPTQPHQPIDRGAAAATAATASTSPRKTTRSGCWHSFPPADSIRVPRGPNEGWLTTRPKAVGR